ncbi:phosphopantothenoylcysteine decarboxylase [Marinicella pacifica]|jgi:phosphopantothenoylcysteine decarboxylase/phosphopantothenate--cysteine ligase|uniref:Phosphopantothenoylcysteine decarboxylase n=1 Tax=Marinicella pacifica TaxID=1171543 RepID=A0A917CKP3_9GAMM|nr:flavoprotein [Marinicella pacifica]GGF91816.1 phosphopantothenoylcysteine decarboxylase [Marinicella pacifica]
MKKLLLMSGSIACAKTSGLISAWVKAGDQVQVVVTPSVKQFIGYATLEGLSGRAVMDNVYVSGAMMDHINISRWADAVILCPATANVMNKIVAGIADEVVSTVWMAAYGQNKPMVVVPAMNTKMWDYPATQSSVKTLKKWGVNIIKPKNGILACGEEGAGRLPEVDELLTDIEALLCKS